MRHAERNHARVQMQIRLGSRPVAFGASSPAQMHVVVLHEPSSLQSRHVSTAGPPLEQYPQLAHVPVMHQVPPARGADLQHTHLVHALENPCHVPCQIHPALYPFLANALSTIHSNFEGPSAAGDHHDPRIPPQPEQMMDQSGDGSGTLVEPSVLLHDREVGWDCARHDV